MIKFNDSCTITAAVCAVISFILLIFPTTPFVHSARVLAGYSLFPSLYYSGKIDEAFRNVPANIIDLITVKEENVRLRQKIKDLELEAGNYRGLAAENERLSSAMQVASRLKWKGVWGKVISKTPGCIYEYLFIDKGGDDGIEANDTVLGIIDGSAFLAGRVSEVYSKFSKVMLLTNESFSVMVSPGAGKSDSLARGTGGPLLQMNFYPAGGTIEKDAEIVTSSAGELFPGGINVGRVAKVTEDQKSFMDFISVTVLPFGDVNSLKEIYVLKRRLPDALVALKAEERAASGAR
mgnify:CR=1 FL=1